MLRLFMSSFCLVTTATIVGCSSEDSLPASESESTSIVEQDAKKEKFSFDTPEAAFEVFTQALLAKDWPMAITMVSVESQKMLASGLVMDASFSTFEDKATEQALNTLLKKHGIDLNAEPEPGDENPGFDSFLDSVKDVPALVTELTEWTKTNIDRSSKSGFPELGGLDKVVVDGEKATARVDSDRGWMPLEFHKSNDCWVIHLPMDRSPTDPVEDDGTSGIGTLWIDDTAFKLREVMAYPGLFFDKPCTRLLFTERQMSPKQFDSMKKQLEETGRINAMALGGHVEVMLNKDDQLQDIFAWAENQSFSIGTVNSDEVKVTVSRDSNRISGGAAMPEPVNIGRGDKTFRFEVEFDTEIIQVKTSVLISDGESETMEFLESAETAWPDDEFEWPKAPDQLATISGHWSLEAGTIYFSSEGKTVLGDTEFTGTFEPLDADSIEFRWRWVGTGFADVQEGVNYFFETTIDVDTDTELPFDTDEPVNIRFVPGEYTKGVFCDLFGENQVPFTKLDKSPVAPPSTKTTTLNESPVPTPAEEDAESATIAGGPSSVPSAEFQPATIQEMIDVIDLATVPQMEGARVKSAGLCHLTFEAPGTLTAAGEFCKKTLSQMDWLEQNMSVEGLDPDKYCQFTFEKSDFTVTVFISAGDKPDQVLVNLTNWGDVDPRRLPRLDEVELTMNSRTYVSFTSSASPAAAEAYCRKEITALGWKLVPDPNLEFLREQGRIVLKFVWNAIELGTVITVENGKTSIAYYTTASQQAIEQFKVNAVLQIKDSSGPATNEQAIGAIDLREFPRLEAASVLNEQSANLNYTAEGDVTDATSFYRRQLNEQGWKEQTPPILEDTGNASLNFKKDGFSLHLWAAKSDEPGKVDLSLSNRGNVDVRQLPLFPGGRIHPGSEHGHISYTVTGDGKAVAEFYYKQLAQRGWKEFTESGGSHSTSRGTVLVFLQKAIRLTIEIGQSSGDVSVQVHALVQGVADQP
ncbi:MAG: hypothetical protein MK102_13920 [Fuerstiella sp.]|nr:hypothetical protein [Fuerstiella sp.]